MDIIVTNDDTCPTDYDLIIYRPWLGTNLWCVCRYFGDQGYIKSIKSYEGDCVEPDRPDYGGECLQLEALHPVIMGQFKGSRVCGKRDGDAFVDVTRPGSDGKCPEGTTPCSKKTSVDNTVCY